MAPAGSEPVWVSVATTDRPVAFAALCEDLASRVEQSGISLRLLVVDNSQRDASRSSNARALAGVSARGIATVHACSPTRGESIARARLRQRELVRETRCSASRPGLVWMLDDDVRLRHVVWADGSLRTVVLHDHLDFLLALRAARPDIDVLVGEVTGDPPIPTLATLTTRFADLLGNISRMFASEPGAAWEVHPATLDLLRGPDAYYDLSVERLTPAWEKVACWLPRRAKVTVAEAYAEMLSEALYLPLGIAFTRPILADPARFSALVDGTRRGGNAVFFDVDACLEHDYPVALVAGIETRRSDMIGTRLLAGRRRARVMTSGFSVVHARPRDTGWPAPEDLHRMLLADTLGAYLAREVQSRLTAPGHASPDFRAARVARVLAARASLADSLRGLAAVSVKAPSWVDPGSILELRSLLEWARGCVTATGGDATRDELARALSSEEVHGQIALRADEIVQGGSR